MGGLKRDLPIMASYPAESAAERKRIKGMIKEAAEAIDSLRDSLQGCDIPHDLKGIANSDWLDSYVAAKLASLDNIVDAAEALSPGAIAFAKKRWINIKGKAHENVEKVKALLDANPTGKFTYVWQEHSIQCANLDAIVERNVSEAVPPTVEELYRLYCGWHDSLQRLNRFCKENGFNEWKPSQINNFKSPTEFINAWLLGAFDVNPTPDQLKRRYKVMGSGNGGRA